MEKITKINTIKLGDFKAGALVGVTGSQSTAFEINVHIAQSASLMELESRDIYIVQKINNDIIVSIGEFSNVETYNPYHEKDNLRIVISNLGAIPGYTEAIDSRNAIMNVHYSYNVTKKEQYILSSSPATGTSVYLCSDSLLNYLMDLSEINKKYITYIGSNNGLNIPFGIKQFKNINDGAAYNGSAHTLFAAQTRAGKSVAASMVMVGQAKHVDMNIIVYDTMRQFYLGRELVPVKPGKNKVFFDDFLLAKHPRFNRININAKFQKDLKNIYSEESKTDFDVNNITNCLIKYNIFQHIVLPHENVKLAMSLLKKNNFIRNFAGITTADKAENFGDAFVRYIERRRNNPNFNWANENPETLLTQFANRFIDEDNIEYMEMVYSQRDRCDKLRRKLRDSIEAISQDSNCDLVTLFSTVSNYFRNDNEIKITPDVFANLALRGKGNFIILDPSNLGYSIDEEFNAGNLPSDDEDDDEMKALMFSMLQSSLQKVGKNLYSNYDQGNLSIYIDEAHRLIGKDFDSDIQLDLSKKIVRDVRQNGKYGIGTTLITQTLASLDKEILQQMKNKFFGFGLTESHEFNVIKNMINNDSAMLRYKRFIDPESNGKYPFMVSGPIATFAGNGSPVFLNVYDDISKFQ